MKKIYKSFLFIVSLIASSYSFATVHNISVLPGSFSPSSVNAVVGDTIVWMWSGGPHSTTSTTIPSGATPWDTTFSAQVPGYVYVVMIPGTYNYVCNVHSFAGEIIVSDPSGINGPEVSLNFNISNVRQATYNISYNLRRAGEVRLSMYDITGKLTKDLNSEMQAAGEFNKTYSFEDLPKGIYIVELLAGNQRIIKRIIID